MDMLSKLSKSAFWVLLLSVFFSNDTIGCTLICNDTINVDIGMDGFTVIDPDMLLERPASCLDPKVVDVFVSGVSIGDTVRCDLFGEILKAKVSTTTASPNSCTAHIRIEDKSAPVISCRDTIVPCGLDPDSILLASAMDNCDPNPTLFASDMILDSTCVGNVYHAVIKRTWGAKDWQNNLALHCHQNIFFKKASLSNVTFPRDTVVPDTVSSSAVVMAGMPMIDGHPIRNFCKFNVLHEDIQFDICPGSYKILRKWIIINCCTNQRREGFQTIELMNVTPPVVVCPDTLSVSISPDDCVANFMLPPATVTDDEDPNPTVVVQYPGGILQSNGGVITNLPEGNHDFLYIGSDACGNKDTCITVVVVEDDIEPTPICIEKLVVNINSRGEGCVRATSVDQGSSDNCCLDTILIKRMDDPISAFSDQLCLTCADIDSVVMAITRFIDCAGNINECMTEIRAQDKIAPQITCPDSIGIHCTKDPRDTSITGSPTAIDNCDSIAFQFVDDTSSLSMCNTGEIIRTWYAIDQQGLRDSCIQKITLFDDTPTVFVNIPNDTTIACDTDINNINTGEPDPISDCEQWGLNIKDTILMQQCTFKILRTFTFFEWCSQATRVFDQEITVIDTIAPAWDQAMGSLDSTYDCTRDVVLMEPTATDGCAGMPLIQQVFYDSIPGRCPNEFKKRVGYLAEDDCGNISDTFFIHITVNDTIPPTISNLPADTIINCDATFVTPPIGLADNCGGATLRIEEIKRPATCPATEIIEELFIVMDVCANRDSMSRFITKIDTIPPTAPPIPPLRVACPEDVPAPDASVVLGAIDNCGGPVSVTLFQDDIVQNRCIDTLIRIYQLTDSCGNFSRLNHQIILKDTIPPRVQSCPGMRKDTIFTGFRQCEGLVQDLKAVYLDNCPGTNVTVTNDSPFAFSQDSCDAVGIYPLGTHNFKMIGTDECLNVNDLCEVELTVVEIDRPQIICAPEPIFVDIGPGGIGTITAAQIIPEAFDWCSTVELNVAPLQFNCADYSNNPGHRVDLTVAEVIDTFGNVRGCLPTTITLRDPDNRCTSPPPAPPGFAGGIITSADGYRMKDVEIILSGNQTDTFMTGNYGGYIFENLPKGEELTFTPQMDDLATAGISTFDLVMIRDIIMDEADYVTPYQYIAADVNNSGHVSILDLVELRKVVLQQQHEFTNNSIWRFIDKDFVFQNLDDPLSENFPESITQIHNHSDFEMDFIGVKVGDLNQSVYWDSMRVIADRAAPSLFLTENVLFEKDEKVSVSISSTDDLRGFQFALAFDESQLNFEQITPLAKGASASNFNISKIQKGIILVSFNEAIESETPLFEIAFTANTRGDLRDALSFDESRISAEVYSHEYRISRAALEFYEEGIEIGQQFELFQNQPNPFSNQTTIGCRIEQPMIVILEVFDLTGKIILRQRKQLPRGIHSFRIDNKTFGKSGVYSYKLKTPFGVQTKRMIFIR